MKILITGLNGQLGHEFYHMLKNHEEVIGYGKQELDITDSSIVNKVVGEENPDVVINCAAYTNVDGCEKDIDLAYRINAIGAQNLASVCMMNNIKLVHISTDFVFDGNSERHYVEFDKPNPLSIYGKSKYAGEQIIRGICPKHFIVRTAWLYGINGNNFIKTMLRLSQERDTLTVVNDQFGTPTYTKDLAKEIYRLIKTNNFGTYHISNKGECSWYDFSRKIFELTNINIEVLPITTEDLGRPARRPKYSVLKNYMLELTIGDQMRNWEVALEEYISQLKSKDRI